MSSLIVVGVDGSPGALRAVRWGAAEAAYRNAALRLVNGFGIPGACYGEAMPPRDWLDVHRDQSLAWLREAAREATHEHPGLDVDTESSLDSPIPLLLSRSDEASLMVLGSAGRGVLGDLVVGSCAAALTAHARCPVAVIRGSGADGDGPVVVGVDGSPANEPALVLAFEEAALRGVSLVALHAAVGETETFALADALGEWEKKFPDTTVRWLVENAHPRQQLLEWSARARLLVAGTRGRGGFPGLRLGSTSQVLLHHAECPVLFVPVSREI
ncbi:universal stress protein [Amycolatopsis acidicola]|uniref:Universal stress protein n=1 Tax=Amycolatopsis acidicola TaxID=2596893 RepID=A0A5N0V509_9PSEU|nr:universal stress protein [Amycolatopsis acidicola]KAA9160210.1 universal stress protein [Amycolatopsis acidicola]